LYIWFSLALLWNWCR